MITHPDPNAVSNFWQWFAENVHRYEASSYQSDDLGILDSRILQLGAPAWELGPAATSSGSQLVISPGGNAALLNFTEEIVAAAPSLPGWTFYYAKPPKQLLKLVFQFEKQHGGQAEVDASNWKYTLSRYEDGAFDIAFKPDSPLDLGNTDRFTLAEILLDSILGEEVRVLKFGGWEIKDNRDVLERGITGIKHLKAHFEGLV